MDQNGRQMVAVPTAAWDTPRERHGATERFTSSVMNSLALCLPPGPERPERSALHLGTESKGGVCRLQSAVCRQRSAVSPRHHPIAHGSENLTKTETRRKGCAIWRDSTGAKRNAPASPIPSFCRESLRSVSPFFPFAHIREIRGLTPLAALSFANSFANSFV